MGLMMRMMIPQLLLYSDQSIKEIVATLASQPIVLWQVFGNIRQVAQAVDLKEEEEGVIKARKTLTLPAAAFILVFAHEF